jgi:hypothetical protein
VNSAKGILTLLALGVLTSVVFAFIGRGISARVVGSRWDRPSAQMTLAIVEMPDGPVLTSSHLAKDLAERAGLSRLQLVETRYRTTRLPIIPWRFGGQLGNDNRVITLSYARGSWKNRGEYLALSPPAHRIVRDFNRSDAVTDSVEQCRTIIEQRGAPALVLTPLGWIAAIAVPVGYTACIVLLTRRLARPAAAQPADSRSASRPGKRADT